ncbi:MAG: RNA 2',3'-cyclic phosphodiesterase [Betaproteobacteria bacterium]|nr:RNA 2',3'-cyclic phosphodiesterase [Betaproteobacteria bacterium]
MTETAADGRAGETARVFFALWPLASLAAELSAIAARWAQSAGGRATRRDTIHLTLAFLGDVPTARLGALRRAAERVRGESFDLTLNRAGVWRHNRIAWVGADTVPPALAGLAGSLAGELAAAGFAVADPGRRFVPHVTLVRKVLDLTSVAPPFAPLLWRCDRFVLVRSRLSAKGSDYEQVAETPLLLL